MDTSNHQIFIASLAIILLSCKCSVNCLHGEEITKQGKMRFDERDTPTESLGIAGLETFTLKQLDMIKTRLLDSLSMEHEIVQSTLAMTLDQVIVMIAARAGWKKRCHMHTSDANMIVVQGSFYFKLHDSENDHVVNVGDRFLVPKWHPHSEGTYGDAPVVIIVKWVPIPKDKSKMTVFLSEMQCDNRYIPNSVLPTMVVEAQPANTLLPKIWTASAIAHPFSPRQSGDSSNNPFAQISKVKLSYNFKKKLFYILVKGCRYGTWLYKMEKNKTFVKSGGRWVRVNMGWTFPSRDWLGNKATFFGRSELNWMNKDKEMDWWAKPYKETSVWFWFDSYKSGVPFRIMFSQPPPSRTKGDPKNLAFFQMFAFTYIVNFKSEFVNLETSFSQGNMFDNTGLECGNPGSFPLFNWTSHFSMSAFMLSVHPSINPIPTHVLYRWKDGDWDGARTDRLQKTDLFHKYNPTNPGLVTTAALFGGWSNTNQRSDGYMLNSNPETWKRTCDRIMVDGIAIGQQPPWWPILGSAEILAVIRKPTGAPSDWISPLTGSDRTIAIVGVIFPPHLPQYPDSTYLWTWYDYTDYLANGKPARPVTFMQSATSFGQGTDLALADYFDFHQYPLENHVDMPMPYLESSMDGICNGMNHGGPTKNLTMIRPEAFFPRIN